MKAVMSMNTKTIIISSIGSPAGQGVVRCLRDTPNIRTIGLDANPKCPNKKAVDKFHVVPKVSDPAYLDVIHTIIAHECCDLFIPTIQPDLLVIDEIAKMTQVLSSKYEAIVVSSNKRVVYEKLVSSGLSAYVPNYFAFCSDEELTFDRLKQLAYPSKPVLIKPEHGGLAFKKIVLGTWDQVAQNLFAKKDHSWRTLNELKELLKQCDPIKNLLAMEYLPGDEYSVDALIMHDQVRIAVPRKRNRVSGGIVTHGIVERKEELIGATEKILPVFGLEYFVNVQFKYAEDGLPKLIDINPRFCGSHIMSYGAGVNFPLLAVKAAFNEEVDFPEPRWGTQMTRYWESVFHDPESNTTKDQGSHI